MQVQIQEYTETHYLVIVTTRKGYSYASTWAKGGQELTKQDVINAWKENRRAFEPWYGRLS
ncbi:hypothetical protein [Paenibacillus dendritiformis]|uniref:hypothetical protein n=1 Tax=Paenibacillus dendritiformis TaxID=130049 RepID=UPI00387E20DB